MGAARGVKGGPTGGGQQPGGTSSSSSAPRMAGQYGNYQQWMKRHPAQEGQTQQERDSAFLQHKEHRVEHSIQGIRDQLAATDSDRQTHPIWVQGQLRPDPIASLIGALRVQAMRSDLRQDLQSKRRKLDEIRRSKALYTPGAASATTQPSTATTPAPSQQTTP